MLGSVTAKSDSAVLSLRDEGIYGPRIRELGVPVYALGIHGARAATYGCLEYSA